jgi:hypothetical protein
MACPMEDGIDRKGKEKLQKYQQLAYGIRERRPGYKVTVLPIVIGCLGGGERKLESQF